MKKLLLLSFLCFCSPMSATQLWQAVRSNSMQNVLNVLNNETCTADELGELLFYCEPSVEIAELLAMRGANLDVRAYFVAIPYLRNALMKAAYWGDAPICELLLRQKASVNLGADSGSTALFEAKKKGKVDCVALLLQHQASVNIIKDKFGDTGLTTELYFSHVSEEERKKIDSMLEQAAREQAGK